jgi:hypothetical protein
MGMEKGKRRESLNEVIVVYHLLGWPWSTSVLFGFPLVAIDDYDTERDRVAASKICQRTLNFVDDSRYNIQSRRMRSTSVVI